MRYLWTSSLMINLRGGLCLCCFLMFQGRRRTLNVCVLGRRGWGQVGNIFIISEIYFIGLFQGLWYKEGISPMRMEQGESLYMMANPLMMRISSINTRVLASFQWLTRVPTPIPPSFSSPSEPQCPNSMIITWCSELSLVEWMWFVRLRN